MREKETAMAKNVFDFYFNICCNFLLLVFFTRFAKHLLCAFNAYVYVGGVATAAVSHVHTHIYIQFEMGDEKRRDLLTP